MMYVISISPAIGDVVGVYNDKEEACREARRLFDEGLYGVLLVQVKQGRGTKQVDIISGDILTDANYPLRLRDM